MTGPRLRLNYPVAIALVATVVLARIRDEAKLVTIHNPIASQVGNLESGPLWLFPASPREMTRHSDLPQGEWRRTVAGMGRVRPRCYGSRRCSRTLTLR
ncbi:hypothetical protein CA85_20330 [Allorhodopirellula solitaria]|uniref:Uncharacterized protein n=1 Tax=Allorhodopirellula solitaria TaxID=2527987 RepID=A0A5C5XWA4_9BACT|nr:hypothetical protein CA85_20330 [Allorhodopirellula solitaria]